jgi:catechol 2,3-dioxygenase-like lactoylglutathione lyase family enzyme
VIVIQVHGRERTANLVTRYDRAQTAVVPDDAYWTGSPVAGGASMLDHLSIQCADVAASAVFYDAVLAPLGGKRVMEFEDVIGFGVPPKPDFWIGPRATGDGFRECHIAFSAPDRTAVRAFYEAAVATGAEVLHEPRVWSEYHPNYFGVFVRDPDGNNVEAVCHNPQ